jgi:hypothetical protein
MNDFNEVSEYLVLLYGIKLKFLWPGLNQTTSIV